MSDPGQAGRYEWTENGKYYAVLEAGGGRLTATIPDHPDDFQRQAAVAAAAREILRLAAQVKKLEAESTRRQDEHVLGTRILREHIAELTTPSEPLQVDDADARDPVTADNRQALRAAIEHLADKERSGHGGYFSPGGCIGDQLRDLLDKLDKAQQVSTGDDDDDLDSPPTPAEEADMARRLPVEAALEKAESAARSVGESDLAACLGTLFFLWDLGQPGIERATRLLTKVVAEIRAELVRETHLYEAVLLGEGWTVLSPWIVAQDGSSYRHHIGDFAQDGQAARHLAAELNRTRG